MTRASDIAFLCEVADEWAGEYGFVEPARADAVRRAIFRLCPEALDPRDREHYAKATSQPDENGPSGVAS